MIQVLWRRIFFIASRASGCVDKTTFHHAVHKSRPRKFTGNVMTCVLTPTARWTSAELVLWVLLRLEQSAYLTRLSWSRQLVHTSAKNVMVLSTQRWRFVLVFSTLYDDVKVGKRWKDSSCLTFCRQCFIVLFQTSVSSHLNIYSKISLIFFLFFFLDLLLSYFSGPVVGSKYEILSQSSLLISRWGHLLIVCLYAILNWLLFSILRFSVMHPILEGRGMMNIWFVWYFIHYSIRMKWNLCLTVTLQQAPTGWLYLRSS